jgi:Flp pilus assembly protein protease CpaA
MPFIVLLLYAAYTDYTKRKIPNFIVIIILVLSIFHNEVPITERIVGFLIPAMPLFLIALKYEIVKGGDVKFLSAVGAYLGLYSMAYILIPATLTAVVWGYKNKEKSVPLAFVFAVGYIILKAIIFMKGG